MILVFSLCYVVMPECESDYIMLCSYQKVLKQKPTRPNMNDIEILEAWVKDLWRLLNEADENAAYEWAVNNIGEEDMHLVR